MAKLSDPTPDADAWMERAAQHYRQQDLISTDHALAQALRIAPDDPRIAFLHAQTRYELGYPAAELFAAARALDPGNRDALRNHALALASEGLTGASEAVLEQALSGAPDWLEGQRVLASIRWTLGGEGSDGASAERGFAQACGALPGHQGLWLGWFTQVAQRRDWKAASAVLDQAEAAMGAGNVLAIARTFVAEESGDLDEAERRLAALAGNPDPFLALSRIRHALRRNQPEVAVSAAEPLLDTTLAGQIWPYLSIAWRLMNDPKAAWLDGDPVHYAVLDPGFTAAELDTLAAQLRLLHTARRPYAEQSVRGGTQTDRSLLLRHEPILRATRIKLMAAVRRHADSLPTAEPNHPLLGRPRTNLSIAGSWSVLLHGGGNNVAHSHPVGWLSSAFYVAVPDGQDMGPAPAGYLRLGAPPPDLGHGLPPYAKIAPAPGKLVLFASTMWHDTVPFVAGERLNIAFDIATAP